MLVLASIHLLLMLLSGAESFMESQKPKEYLISETAKKDLMKLDKDLITNLMEYSDKLKKKITQLQMIAREIREPLDAAKGMEEEYLSNPLHSFPLIRHMHQDWPHIEKFMKMPVGQDEINFLQNKLPELPASEDSKDASKAMYRLARTYNVTPWELSNGLIDGIQLGISQTHLTPLDFFEIGKLCFQWEHTHAALLWFTSTPIFEEYEPAHKVLGFRKNDVALMIARCLVELGRKNEAEDVLREQSYTAVNMSKLIELYDTHSVYQRNYEPIHPLQYTDLCRSSHVPSPSRLHCRYNSSTSPFLILAPLKMEEISLDPYIVVYHDVLSTNKIEEIIRWGDPRVEPTYVLHRELGDIRNNERTALGTWISRNTLPPSNWNLLRYMSQKIRYLTGLKVMDLFSLQLIKYGFGAHYGPHTDYFNSSNRGVKLTGDRIATALFYLNDAPHGGATVFPELKLKVNAERGKVLFWYNLKGETHDLDEKTMHGACPIIKGFKYVLTAWIDEWDQMFIQPTYRQGIRHHFF
ncbi:prolyl 4-hydroxylase subunit alpha-2-like [Drosophila serrata]|uniref:prolyl 4-hydroxylase subunit alpha-2-like n=1 Tax=Drosophila serrata TaxID=7274 RepID=UPI000A1CF59B|nr:prolyl 4-hydroxylase subunit alpha-2-like [Drosophila serrata]